VGRRQDWEGLRQRRWQCGGCYYDETDTGGRVVGEMRIIMGKVR
jgi:hypothetical protein